MDSTDIKILKILQTDARISMKKLGEIVNLTSPAVTERVRKLEEAGVIKNYITIIDPNKINKNIQAFITLTINSINYSKFSEYAPTNPNITECHHITGGDCMIIKVMVPNMEDLEILIHDLKRFGNTQTNLILSTPFMRKLNL
ncbi:MAG: Lrp/AsnC family transcriptional regulator [Bacillota bacterium]|nr:Lrp/AsnC family transcriptional regulator [Bacillota bacterium]